MTSWPPRLLAHCKFLAYIPSHHMKLTPTIQMTQPLLKPTKQKERRRSPRVTPDPLLTICLPSGNYGIVLDVSHDGVGFLASSPVEEAQTIRFEISARSTRGPEAVGQLMWKDNSGKRGGLRFTNVPEDLRELIRPILPGRQSLAAQPALAAQIPLEIAAEEPKILGSDDIPNLPQFEERIPRFRQASSRKEWTAFANAVTATLACLIALAIWYSLNDSIHRRAALSSFSHLKAPFSTFFTKQIARLPRRRTTPKIPMQTLPEKAASKDRVVRFAELNVPLLVAPPIGEQTVKTEIPSTPGAPALPTTAPQKIDAITKAPQADASVPAAAPTQIQGTIETHDPDQTEIALARKLLREDSDASNPPKVVQLLWQAVEKGSAPAEIELAGLYLAGRGVSKSCSQALVLLTAAQNHKSALAEQRLRSLPRYGCDPTRDPTTPASSESPGAASTTQ